MRWFVGGSNTCVLGPRTSAIVFLAVGCLGTSEGLHKTAIMWCNNLLIMIYCEVVISGISFLKSNDWVLLSQVLMNHSQDLSSLMCLIDFSLKRIYDLPHNALPPKKHPLSSHSKPTAAWQIGMQSQGMISTTWGLWPWNIQASIFLCWTCERLIITQGFTL